MKLRTIALALCLLLLAGCADQYGAVIVTTNGGGSPESEEAQTAPEEQAEPETEPENLFEVMPREYMFCSGAGAWSTTLTIETDGSFTGLFLDADMGDGGEMYPEGTRYVCNFSGKFTQPEKVDGTTYSMRIETIELERPADEAVEYADNVRYIYSGPYGLEEAEELLIYLPASKAADLPEGAIRAARGPYDWQAAGDGTLGLYVIYNAYEEHGFVEYPRVTGQAPVGNG